MDCNKDDAIKAKQVAEKKFVEMDIATAVRFALRAHSLYPSLDGLPQFIATLNVYLSAEKRIDGCIDWYRILGVDPLADEETIRKHYRKLALILHPDKNKSIGADGAFKIVSEAWSCLSDKAKRAVFDHKRNIRGMPMKSNEIRSPVPIVRNGFHNLFPNNNLNRWQWRSDNEVPSAPASHPVKPTFWTMCNSCKVHFEYLRSYLNHNLICPNCRISFLAVENPSPPFNGNPPSSPWTFNMQQQASSAYNHFKKSFNVEKTEFSARGSMDSAGYGSMESMHKSFHSGTSCKVRATESTQASASSAAKAFSFFKSSSPKMKVGHKDGISAAMKEEFSPREDHIPNKGDAGLASTSFNNSTCSAHKGDRRKKKMRISGHKMQGNIKNFLRQIEIDNAGIIKESSGSQKYSFEGRRPITGKFRPPNNTRELSQVELRQMLMGKARNEICKKLNEWKADASSTILQRMANSNKNLVEEKEGKSVVLNGMESSKDLNTACSKDELQTTYTLPSNSSESPDTKDSESFSMSVPDPDFYDFDKDRAEKSFGSNQVWAVYDDDDGMPRYYAMVHKVLSLKPFKMRISWLNSKSNIELAPLNWIGCGFPKTSGDFWIGKHEDYGSLNSFSHKVKQIKGKRGAIRIFPSKGDVWALYRNWSPDWNELTPDDVIHKYDMVEVLEDYNEDKGAAVVPLVKVVGFKTVFKKHSNPSKIRNIPREEMFRFSHQVPSCLLTGLEGQNAPAGCWELDPAATPLELLQVANEAEIELEEAVESAEQAKDRHAIEAIKCAKASNLENNVETTMRGLEVQDNVKVEDLMMHNGNKTTVPKMIVYSRKRFRGKLPIGAELSAH
ncbi:meiotically up-regulated gene 184 protein-like protein [Cucumis melo var. makuwa]|uniref:Meiotically up-regulated gene 184 protein-like protein n=2 Tax=Cucumis melo TaxID=3656 RepID=A0A5D3BHC3_CUCMM|nr:meiotically up-regulated gene 184 protein-like protein [Cucumis melo var. makuwa]